MNEYNEHYDRDDEADEIAKELREDQDNYHRSDEEGWFYSEDENNESD